MEGVEILCETGSEYECISWKYAKISQFLVYPLLENMPKLRNFWYNSCPKTPIFLARASGARQHLLQVLWEAARENYLFVYKLFLSVFNLTHA